MTGIDLSTPSDTEIRMARTFDAPRDLVWRLWTDAERIPEYWGWRDSETIVHTWDLRPGGAWRISSKGQDGAEWLFFGEFRDVEPNELLVWTFGYEGMNDDPLVESLRFEEHDGRTTLVSTSTFETREARDAMLDTGMADGAAVTYDRFEELLERELARA
jgi:uncharacterized protein YndB with AHSA1/START domain